VNLGQAAITLERVEEVRLKPAERNLELPERDLSGQGELVLDHVSFHYRPEYPVLHDVSVTIAPGEVVAFVGETGSGKTSIARLLTRLRIPAGGTISLDGIDYDELSPRQVRDQVTAVFQDSKLLQRTIRENLTLGRDATDEEIIEALAAAQAVSVVQGLRLGLDANAARAGATLSAGQLQRLALARALLRNPPVLILDEATANLDSRTERELLEAVLTHRTGRTTIMIAHRLTAVQRADRVVVLADGRVVQDGAPSELMAVDGQFRRLFEDQFADRFADGLQQPAPTS
jgi:ATP-binding cassette subfamily B protein